MLSETEIKILKRLFEDLTKIWNIREVSLDLKMHYPQAYRSIKSLIKRGLIKYEKRGKSNLLALNFETFKEEYISVEIERKKEITHKYKVLGILEKDLGLITPSQYTCILFGSYAEKKAKKNSDIDLLFVIPEEYDYSRFEREVKNKLTVPGLDIHITTERGLLEMWYNPLRFNVGNQLLKKHIVLRSTESFLYLRFRYYHGGS